MDEIEKNVKQQLLHSITGKNYISDEDHSLFALSLRMGGLDLLNNTNFSINYEWSRAISDPLENSDPRKIETEQNLINRNLKKKRRNIALSKKAEVLKKLLIRKKKRTKNLASQKGSSNWLRVLPL